jgi:hypothetical protein
MIIGAVAGIVVGLGRVPYLAGAAQSLADTAQHLVADGGRHLIADVASAGAPQRVVLAFTALIGVLLPGVTALLLVLAARGTLRLRSLVALAIVALGALSFVYQPRGVAGGELVLALAAAGLAVVLSGPLLAAPLAGLAALIGTMFLPQLVSGNSGLALTNVNLFHQALTGTPGTPAALQVVLLVVAAVPFALAGRMILES